MTGLPANARSDNNDVARRPKARPRPLASCCYAISMVTRLHDQRRAHDEP